MGKNTKQVKQLEGPTTEVSTETAADDARDISIAPAAVERQVEPHRGASMLKVTRKQMEILARRAESDDYLILPTGELYLSQVHYRKRLTEAFGPGSWALLDIGKPILENNMMMQKVALYVRDHYVASAIGESEYFPNNKRMTYPKALEAARSKGLVRCCKDLCIGAECWDKRFCQRFIREHCVMVWVQSKREGMKKMWRRKDEEPFFGESGPVHKKDGASSRAAGPEGGERQEPEVERAQADKQVQQADLFGLENNWTKITPIYVTAKEVQHGWMYSVKFIGKGQQRIASTFDDRMGEALQAAHRHKSSISVQLERNGSYLNIVGVIDTNGQTITKSKPREN